MNRTVYFFRTHNFRKAPMSMKRQMKRQHQFQYHPVLQSAAFLALACVPLSSHSAAAFVSISSTASIHKHTGVSISGRGSGSGTFAHNSHTESYSRTSSPVFRSLHMSLAPHKLHEDEVQMEDFGDRLLLPYEDAPHSAAKIIIPENESSNGNWDLYNDDDGNRKRKLSLESFQKRLEATILTCKQLHKKSLWLEIPMSKARYIEACSNIPNLQFHHASGTTAHLCLWLMDDVECMIPEFATHQIGVGAIVVNSRDEILCVKELRKNYRPWKVPGGLAELGEQLDEAAIREVLEETGIKCEFQSVLGFRHTHGMQFGRSDMYFVCRLKPIEGGVDGDVVIPDPVPQQSEIAAAAWIPLQEYKDMINHGENPHPMMQKMMSLYELDEEKNHIQRTVINSIVPGRIPSPMYHGPGV